MIRVATIIASVATDTRTALSGPDGGDQDQDDEREWRDALYRQLVDITRQALSQR